MNILPTPKTNYGNTTFVRFNNLQQLAVDPLYVIVHVILLYNANSDVVNLFAVTVDPGKVFSLITVYLKY